MATNFIRGLAPALLQVLSKDRLMAYHGPYLEVENHQKQGGSSSCRRRPDKCYCSNGHPNHHPCNQNHQSNNDRNHGAAVMIRRRPPGTARWPEMVVHNSVISIILAVLVVASQFSVIVAINAVAEGGGELVSSSKFSTQGITRG